MIDTTYCQEYFDKVKAAAEAAGPEVLAEFEAALDYLDKPNGTSVTLTKDWAPWSFAFVKKRADGSYAYNGGLLYTGPGLGDTGQQTANGGAPLFAVDLCPADPGKHTWRVHT